MGKLIDLDAVLSIDMSKRAKDKVMKLETLPAIKYSGEYDTHCLACALLCAYRYAINRHFTECMIRSDMDKIILQNLDLFPDDFIHQMIAGIHNEYRLWGLRQSEGVKAYCDSNPHYLQNFLDGLQVEWEKRKGYKIPESECV